MNVIPLLILLSLCLAGASVAFYLWSVRIGDADHADRLSLLPLEDDLIEVPRDGTERTSPVHETSEAEVHTS